MLFVPLVVRQQVYFRLMEENAGTDSVGDEYGVVPLAGFRRRNCQHPGKREGGAEGAQTSGYGCACRRRVTYTRWRELSVEGNCFASTLTATFYQAQ